MKNSMTEQISASMREAWDAMSEPETAEVIDKVMADLEGFEPKNARNSMKRRTICQQTVWALARLGLLRTDDDAAVIQAAKKWVLVYDSDSDADLEELDNELTEVVQKLPDYDWKQGK